MSRKIPIAVLAAAIGITGGLMMKWEGTRYVAYKPIPTDPWTICQGHTRGVKQGDTATPEQCERYRNEDMADAVEAVERCIDWPLTANQLGAILDVVVNAGPSVVCGSTLQRKADMGDMRGACRELTHAKNRRGEERGWAHSAGKWMQGLFNRRVDERAICWPDFSNVREGVAFADLIGGRAP